MSLPKPDIVIFDMDGTTVRHVNPRLLHILERVDDFVFSVLRFRDWVFRRKSRMVYDPRELENRRKPRLIGHRAMHKVRRKPVNEIVEPCPGIYAVLTLLAAHNIPIALVSNGLGKGYGHDILKHYGLGGFYRATIFREDIKTSKPNPEALLTALGAMQADIKPGTVIWHIGDRRKDIIAAMAAQNHIAGTMVPIAYGFNAALAVLEKNIGPDHIIMSYYDMLDVLRRLLGHAPEQVARDTVTPEATPEAAKVYSTRNGS